MIVAPGSTSVSVSVQIVDDAGLAVTGLVAATFPATSYERVAEAAVSVTLSDLAAINSAYGSGGVKEISGGFYRLDCPDAAFATTSRVRLIGEASGKHLLCPQIDVQVAGSVRSGTARGGTSGGTFGSITLDAGASATNNLYRGLYVLTTGGAGADQLRPVTSYTGSTQEAFVVPDWASGAVPDATTTFDLIPGALVDLVAVQGSLTPLSRLVALANAYAAGALAASVTSVVGSVASVTNPVTLTAAYDAAKTAAQSSDVPTAAANAAAVLAAGDVDGFSLEEVLKVALAALAGKLSGAATTTITIRAADDSKTRLTATCDSDGNRTAVTIDAAG